MITVNGVLIEKNELSLGMYLDANGYDRPCIAVERNGVVIRSSEYNTTLLRDGDIVEIVQFVGGG